MSEASEREAGLITYINIFHFGKSGHAWCSNEDNKRCKVSSAKHLQRLQQEANCMRGPANRYRRPDVGPTGGHRRPPPPPPPPPLCIYGSHALVQCVGRHDHDHDHDHDRDHDHDHDHDHDINRLPITKRGERCGTFTISAHDRYYVHRDKVYNQDNYNLVTGHNEHKPQNYVVTSFIYQNR